MKSDRYLRTVLTVIAVALSAIALNAWMTTMPLSRAEAQSAQYEVSVPKAWGKVVGFSGGGDVLLEDSEGTLRQVEMYGDKKKDFPRIKVQAKRN
jgi:hypothetical protein